MRRILALMVLGLYSLTPAAAFDSETTAAISGMKVGKTLPISAVATLMRGAEHWCYAEDEGACNWSDIYLEVTEAGATFEIGNAWNETYNIRFTDSGTFRDDRFICEADVDWPQTVQATRRSDDTLVTGRELWALKQEIIAGVTTPRVIDCFDYELRGVDESAETIILLQREYSDGVTDPLNDVTVTLHFSTEGAADLSWYY